MLAHRVSSDCLALSLFFWRSLSYNINYLETTVLVIWSCTNQSTLNWLYFFRFCRATPGASVDKHHLSEARRFLFSRYAEIILNAALLYSSTSIDSSLTQAFSFVWRHTGEKEVLKKKCVWLYICGHKMKEGTAERFNQLRLSRVTRLPHFLPDVGWDAWFYRLLTKKKRNKKQLNHFSYWLNISTWMTMILTPCKRRFHIELVKREHGAQLSCGLAAVVAVG